MTTTARPRRRRPAPASIRGVALCELASRTEETLERHVQRDHGRTQ